MKFSLYRVGLVAGLFILLGGSIVQILGGGNSTTVKSQHSWGNDDAYISYRYAENLVNGKGLVFNPGERVEAYSNFLYVLMMVPAFWVTNDDGVYFFSVFLNLVFAGAAFFLFVDYLQRRLGPGNALAGALLLAFCLPLWVAVASGLETTLVLLISIGIWLAVERAACDSSQRAVILLCSLIMLSILARGDGFIIPGIAILYLLLKRQFRLAAFGAITVFFTFGVYELWRYHYYGFLLPNSYYVKVAGPLGPRLFHAYDQLKHAAIFEGLLVLLLVCLFALAEVVWKAFQGRTRLAEGLRFDLLLPLCWIVYWFYIGGDHFWDRFLIILYPMGIFALLKYFGENATVKIKALAVVMLVALEVGPPLDLDPRFDYVFDKYDCWITLGKFTAQNYPGKTIATGGIGKIPFFSGLYTMDMLGLADPVLAHRPEATREFDPGHTKFDPDYTLSRKPDLIANWIYGNGDLAYELTKAKYEKAGYRLQYLVNTSRTPPPVHIVDVSGTDELSIRRLIARGYDFALLARQ